LRRTSVIPPGISDFFKPGTSKALDPLVVAVGRLVPVKRFDLLVRSFALVHQSVPSARLVIAGEGYLRNELEELIREIGASEYVSLVGRVDDEELRRLYQQAWLVSSASLREGWGMSLTEAAACGTPVVASDIAGHRDAVSDNRSGLLVSDDEIGTGIIRVLSDSALREKLSAGALEYAAELSWDNSALRLFDLLNRS